MNKTFILHAKEPECKTCLIGTWYDGILDAKSAVERGEDGIHTSILYLKAFGLEELVEAGYNVWLMDADANLVRLTWD